MQTYDERNGEKKTLDPAGALIYGRFQVTVKDSLFMRGLERIRYLAGVVESRLHRQRPAERFALDEFHHERAIFHAIDLRDVGMVQGRQHLSLTLESRHAIRVAGESFGQHL